MTAKRKNSKITNQPEYDDLLHNETEIKYYTEKIQDTRRAPGRNKIMIDAMGVIMTDRMVKAYEEGEKLTYRELGSELGIHPATVSTTLKEIRSRWRETSIRDWDKLVQNELAVLDAIEEEAWQAWHRSKADSESYTEEIDDHDRLKKKYVKTGQTGTAKYFDVILKCIAQRSKLLGLEPQQDNQNLTVIDKLVEHARFGRITYDALLEYVSPITAEMIIKKATGLTPVIIEGEK